MSALETLIAELRETCAGLPDKRQGLRPAGTYRMADIGLSAFSLFFMGSPSFLAHQRALAEGHGRSNCQTLFGMTAIPTDNYIRLMLDGAAPAAFDGLFMNGLAALAAADALAPFQRLGGRVLIALDGTEHFCSRKIHCPHCSTRRRSDGGTEYVHAFLGASLVAPGHKQVLPLPPEFIVPQDGAEKQDCERNAAKRWLAKHGPALASYRPVYLGDDLFACQPIAQAVRAGGGSFILTCKPASHRTIAEYLDGADIEEHRHIVSQPGKRSTHIYRWLSGVPLRASADALTVNWFAIEITDAKGKRTYANSFVTDLPVAAETVAELRRLRSRPLEDRERDLQRPQIQRLQPRAQFRPRQADPRQHPRLPQPAGLRLPYRSPALRPRLAHRPRRPRRPIPLLRAPAHHHRLHRLRRLAAPPPSHHRPKGPTTVNGTPKTTNP